MQLRCAPRTFCGRELGAVAIAWLLASAASAGPVAGTLSVILGGLPPVTISGSGSGSSTGSGATLSASVFAATTTVPGTTPIVTALRITAANATGSFSGAPLQGAMAIRGAARLRNGGFTAFTVPLTLDGTRGVGLGGAPIFAGTSASPLTLTGGLWSAGLVQVTGVGTPGNPLTVSLAGSDQRTAMGAGTLTLVTPMRIRNAALGVTVAGFGVLTLSFVPEPGAFLLLVAAAAAAGVALRRARSAQLRLARTSPPPRA